jgi:chromosome segregation ATPase
MRQQPALDAAGAPTAHISERGARAVQAATFALRDQPGASLQAELKVAKSRSPEAFRAPPKRERGRLASGSDRSARRARSRQERRAVGVQAQTQASVTKQKHAEAPDATASPEVARRWRVGVDTRLNRIETAAEYLQDEMEDLREENLDLVDQVNLSLGEADDKCVAMDQLRERMEGDLEKQKKWMEAQIGSVRSTELSLHEANKATARIAGQDTMLLRQMDSILAALGDTTARILAMEKREKGQLAHIAELQAQLKTGDAVTLQALTQEGADKAEQTTTERLAKLEAQVEALMLDEQSDERKASRSARGGRQRENPTTGKLAHRIGSVEKQLGKLDSRLDEYTKTSDENDLKLQRQIEKAARAAADERREVDRLLHTLGENAASTQTGLEEVSVTTSSTRAALKELDEWIRDELEDGRAGVGRGAGSAEGNGDGAFNSQAFDAWASKQEDQFSELNHRLSTSVAHANAESLQIGAKVSDLQQLCEELSATSEELSAQCTEALAHAESGTVGARRSELAALAARVDKLAKQRQQSADDAAVVELTKALGEQMRLTHAVQDQMQTSAADVASLTARVDSIASASDGGSATRGSKASSVDSRELVALESKHTKALEAAQSRLSGSIAQATADMDYRLTEVHSKCEELEAQKKVVQDRFAALEDLQSELSGKMQEAVAAIGQRSDRISPAVRDELAAVKTRLQAFEGTISAGSDFSRASASALDELQAKVEQLAADVVAAQQTLGDDGSANDVGLREDMSALQEQLLELKIEQTNEMATLREEVTETASDVQLSEEISALQEQLLESKMELTNEIASLREEVTKMPALHESLGATLSEIDSNAAAIEDRIERTETSLRVALSTLQKEVQAKHVELESTIASAATAAADAATAAAAANGGYDEQEGVNSAEFASLSATLAAQAAQMQELKANLDTCVTEEGLRDTLAQETDANVQTHGGLSDDIAALSERAASTQAQCDALAEQYAGLLETVTTVEEQVASTETTCSELAAQGTSVQDLVAKIDSLSDEISSAAEAATSARSTAEEAMATAAATTTAADKIDPLDQADSSVSVQLQGELSAVSSRLEELEASTNEEKEAMRSFVADLAQRVTDSTGLHDDMEAIESRLEELSTNTETALASVNEEVEKRANKQHLEVFGELIGTVDQKVVDLETRLEQNTSSADDGGKASSAALEDQLGKIQEELAACTASCTDLSGLTTQVTECADTCERMEARVQEIQVAVSGCVAAAEGMSDLSEKVAGIKSDLSDMVETSYEDMEELRAEMVRVIHRTRVYAYKAATARPCMPTVLYLNYAANNRCVLPSCRSRLVW